ALPDAHALVGGEIQLFPALDIEVRVPGIDVTHFGGAILVGSVTIRQHLLAQSAVADFLSPVLREGNEELLIAVEAVLRGRALACERRAISIVRSGQSAEVGDVLSQRLFSVDGEIGKRTVSVILSGQGGAGFLKVFEVVVSPPVAHTSFGI